MAPPIFAQGENGVSDEGAVFRTHAAPRVGGHRATHRRRISHPSDTAALRIHGGPRVRSSSVTTTPPHVPPSRPTSRPLRSNVQSLFPKAEQTTHQVPRSVLRSLPYVPETSRPPAAHGCGSGRGAPVQAVPSLVHPSRANGAWEETLLEGGTAARLHFLRVLYLFTPLKKLLLPTCLL